MLMFIRILSVETNSIHTKINEFSILCFPQSHLLDQSLDYTQSITVHSFL